MTTTVVENVAPITEYGGTIDVIFSSAAWTAYSLGSGRIVAQFRAHPRSASLLFEADTDDSTITRPGSYTLRVSIPDSAGETLVTLPHVYFDFVHIDGSTYTAVPGIVRWPCRVVSTKKADIT